MDKIIKVKNHFKQKLAEYLLLKNSIKTLSKTSKIFFVLPYGFDEIYYGIKNQKRIKMCIIVCIMLWLVVIWHFLILISPYLWQLFDNPLLLEYGKANFLQLALSNFYCAFVCTNFLLGEMNDHLNALKLFHIITVNLKSIHQLTDKNYNRLAIISRILVLILIFFGLPFFSISLFMIFLMFGIISKRLYYFIHAMLFTGPYFCLHANSLSIFCIFGIYFLYYKFRFDQLNERIKSIIKSSGKGKWRMILPGKEKAFLQLINEHNYLSLEIHKVNLLLRKSVAMMFVFFALFKILSLYLSIKMKPSLVWMANVNGFINMTIFGFGISYLLSHQIYSAQNSYKIIHSVVCKYKMRLQLRLKVNLTM